MRLLKDRLRRWREPITALLKGGFDPPPARLAADGQLSLPPATYYGFAPECVASAGVAVRAQLNGRLCGAAQTSALTFVGHARVRAILPADPRQPGGDPILVPVPARCPVCRRPDRLRNAGRVRRLRAQRGRRRVVGHVERAWGYSFAWEQTGCQLAVYRHLRPARHY